MSSGGGSASAYVQQLVHAHVHEDEQAFWEAATALARSTKIMSVSRSITDLVQMGKQKARERKIALENQARNALQQNGIATPWKPLPSEKHEHTDAPPCKHVQPLRSMSFAELLLPEDLQAQLDEIVQEQEYREELAERNLRARNRLLFHGPPGNGKSASATAIAESLSLRAWGISLPQLVSKYIGETGGNLGDVFETLNSERLIVFDEIDAIGAGRSECDGSAGKEHNSIVNNMLTLMDRYKDGIIVATTNRIDIIDPALLRRFDEHIYFPAPTVEQMRSLAGRLAGKFSVQPCYVDDCKNFDEVTKRVETEARRAVMREILAAEQLGEDDGQE